jgi:hypothetical protein
MTSTESFSTFANRVMAGNNLLIGTTSRIDSTALRTKLELNMSGYLADKLARLRPTEKQRLIDIEVFEDWLSEIILLDDSEEITADLKRIADFASEHITKKQRTDNSNKPMHYNNYPQQQQSRNAHTPAFTPPLSGANTITSNFNNYRDSNNQRITKRLRCPKLLPSEYHLLEKHNGCKKCRKFYVAHRTPDCPNDFPNPETYTTLTEAMALQAMATAAIASTYGSSNTSSSTSPFTSNPIYNNMPSSFVEEVPTKSNSQTVQASVAAILPSTSSTPFVLLSRHGRMETNVSTFLAEESLCSQLHWV